MWCYALPSMFPIVFLKLDTSGAPSLAAGGRPRSVNGPLVQQKAVPSRGSLGEKIAPGRSIGGVPRTMARSRVRTAGRVRLANMQRAPRVLEAVRCFPSSDGRRRPHAPDGAYRQCRFRMGLITRLGPIPPYIRLLIGTTSARALFVTQNRAQASISCPRF